MGTEKYGEHLPLASLATATTSGKADSVLLRTYPYNSVLIRTPPPPTSPETFSTPPLDFFPACGTVQAVDGEKPAAW